MKAYVISLKRNQQRQIHVASELRKAPFIDWEFVEAFDGHALSPSQAASIFDGRRLARRVGRQVRPGEIGCTMSHQECYRRLLRSSDRWVLILEDDLVIPPSSLLSSNLLTAAMDKAEGPSVILLSGWFWWNNSSKIADGASLADVYLGNLTHSYLINREAAELLLCDRPYFFADDWRLFKSLGVNIYGIVPHLIDQDWTGNFKTEVNDSAKISTGVSVWRAIRWVYFSIALKIRALTGRFEPPLL